MSNFQFSLIFAFLAMIFWGGGDFLIQKTIRLVGDLPTLLWINLIAGIGLTPLVIKDLPLILVGNNLLILLIMTVIGLLYSIFLFKAYEKGKLGVVEVLMIGELPLTIILGVVFFKEKFSLIQTIWVLLIILGIFLITKSHQTWWQKFKQFFTGRKFVWEKGALLALAAISFSALYSFLTAVNSRHISALMAVWFPWLLGSLCLFVYIAYQRGLKTFWRNSVSHKGLIIVTTIIDTGAWIFYALAVRDGELSVVTPIVAGYAMIAMFLGIKFNRERIGRWQYLGAVLVLWGVVVFSLISG